MVALKIICFSAKELKNEHTLGHYGIGHDSKLDMFEKSNFSNLWNGMEITVLLRSGKNMSFKVQNCDTIRNIKVMVQRREGIPLRHQRVIFENSQLDDNKTLSDYGIKNKEKLNLVID